MKSSCNTSSSPSPSPRSSLSVMVISSMIGSSPTPLASFPPALGGRVTFATLPRRKPDGVVGALINCCSWAGMTGAMPGAAEGRRATPAAEGRRPGGGGVPALPLEPVGAGDWALKKALDDVLGRRPVTTYPCTDSLRAEPLGGLLTTNDGFRGRFTPLRPASKSDIIALLFFRPPPPPPPVLRFRSLDAEPAA